MNLKDLQITLQTLFDVHGDITIVLINETTDEEVDLLRVEFDEESGDAVFWFEPSGISEIPAIPGPPPGGTEYINRPEAGLPGSLPPGH